MSLRVGRRVWVPCSVKPGPFSDERLVRVESSAGTWLGFVPTSFLREPVVEGATFVGAVVVGLGEGRFTARLPGHAVTPGRFEGSIDKAKPVGALQA